MYCKLIIKSNGRGKIFSDIHRCCLRTTSACWNHCFVVSNNLKFLYKEENFKYKWSERHILQFAIYETPICWIGITYQMQSWYFPGNWKIPSSTCFEGENRVLRDLNLTMQHRNSIVMKTLPLSKLQFEICYLKGEYYLVHYIEYYL